MNYRYKRSMLITNSGMSPRPRCVGIYVTDSGSDTGPRAMKNCRSYPTARMIGHRCVAPDWAVIKPVLAAPGVIPAGINTLVTLPCVTNPHSTQTEAIPPAMSLIRQSETIHIRGLKCPWRYLRHCIVTDLFVIALGLSATYLLRGINTGSYTSRSRHSK